MIRYILGEKPKFFENLDITSVITPINVAELQRLLEDTAYDRQETRFLVEGFANGFDLGYRGPTDGRNFSNNIPLTVGSRTTLWNKIMDEVQLGRFAGPFESPPFDYFIQSPVGLVPKSGSNNKTRLIFRLSYDFGTEERDKLFNYHTPYELCTVKYKDLDWAIKLSLDLLKHSNKRKIFYTKSNLTAALDNFQAIQKISIGYCYK